IGILQRRIERQRAIERALEANRITRRRQFLPAQNAPLFERCVCAREIEPGLRPLRLTLGPSFRRFNRRGGSAGQWLIEAAIIGIELDFPPQHDFGKRQAAFRRRRWTATAKLGARLIESRMEDRVVDRGELSACGQAGCRRWCLCEDANESGDAEHHEKSTNTELTETNTENHGKTFSPNDRCSSVRVRVLRVSAFGGVRLLAGTPMRL